MALMPLMIGGLVSPIASALSGFTQVLANVIREIVSILRNIATWYINTLIEKPEVGLTLTVLAIYMATP